MCADRALLSIGGIVNHLHNCDKIIYRPDSHDLLCRNFTRDATPLVIIADEAPQVCLIICANWNFEREYFVPLGRWVFSVFRFTFEGNRSSPLYAICLNWITFLQCVGFDSKLFYGRHCQIEPDGEHPTSVERNSLITPLCARQTRTLCTHFFLLIAPMPPTINSTNFSSLVSTALPIRFALILNPYG